MNHSSSFDLGDDVGIPVDHHFLLSYFDFGSPKLGEEDGVSDFDGHGDGFSV